MRGVASEWWCLGDLVGYGADPTYSLSRCISDASRCLAGNHDLGADGRTPLSRFSGLAGTALAWTHERLGPVGRNKLARLSPSDPDGEVPLFHASPRDPVWEYVTTVAQARDALEDRRVGLTLIGHTHVPAAWHLTEDGAMEQVPVTAGTRLELGSGRWLVNPGSVGQPRDGDARAAWAVLDTDAGTLEFRRTPYDVAAAQTAITNAGLPLALATRLSEGW